MIAKQKDTFTKSIMCRIDGPPILSVLTKTPFQLTDIEHFKPNIIQHGNFTTYIYSYNIYLYFSYNFLG